MFRVHVPTWGDVCIYFTHFNPDKPNFTRGMIPGTMCDVVNEEKTKIISVGETELMKCDTYCKEFGRKLALTRAIKKLSREERRTVWKEYFNSRGIKYQSLEG